MKTNIRVNDTTHELSLDSRLTLLDALRDVLGLTGTKKGCVRCVHRDYRRPACLVLSDAGSDVRGPGAELATYIVEKGKPLITLVK